MSAKPIDQEKVLKAELARLKPGQFVLFDDKRALAGWWGTITSMESRGLLRMERKIIDDQSTQLRIYRPEEQT